MPYYLKEGENLIKWDGKERTVPFNVHSDSEVKLSPVDGDTDAIKITVPEDSHPYYVVMEKILRSPIEIIIPAGTVKVSKGIDIFVLNAVTGTPEAVVIFSKEPIR